jgi:hypothetical protein
MQEEYSHDWQSDIHCLELIQDLKICGQTFYQGGSFQVFLQDLKLGVIHSALGEVRVVFLIDYTISLFHPKMVGGI